MGLFKEIRKAVNKVGDWTLGVATGGMIKDANDFQKTFIPEFKIPESQADIALANSLRAQAISAQTANANLSADGIANVDIGGTAKRTKRTGSFSSSVGGNLSTALGIR